MIQIVCARLFPGGKKPVFVFTEPTRLFAPGLKAIFTSYNELLSHIPESERVNIFFTVAHHHGAIEASREGSEIRTPQRTASSFDYQTVIPFDLDGADTQRSMEYAAAIAQVLHAPVDALTVVSSGNGVHVYVNLAKPIRDVAYFHENKAAYNELCRLATKVIADAGLPLEKVDPVVFEPARILRLPGSLNAKPDKPAKPCLLVQYREQQLEIDLYALSGLKARANENIPPAEIRRRYPTPDYPAVVEGCEFFKWALAHPAEVHEPHAFDLLSVLAPQTKDAIWQGKTPEQLGRQIFDGATGSDSLKESDFDDKWEQARVYGGRKCETINAHWGKCETCPHWGKATTPLALKSKEHIASEPNGYWVLGGKGQELHPAYEDLCKVYLHEQAIVFSGGRFLAYKDGLYREAPDVELKSWLQRKVLPSEPLRENHRNEFVAALRTENFLDAESFDTKFGAGLRGKLNCLNGVLDIMTGEILPPGPEYGFLYRLPYAVDLSVSDPEYFLDWLDTVTCHDPDLMDSLLDLMAYVLWPGYEDHVFAYLVGAGQNGKSTFIEVIQHMVGEKNHSNVGIIQLGTNRFMPVQLDGKLVNLSEESSGGRESLTFEALNVIKNLSSGGRMEAERKGLQGYSFQNRAKLIFSANTPPRFQEDGVAMQRRMLAIPFDYHIERMDPRVKPRLFSEVPRILAFLVKRTRDILNEHGHFVVRRGGMRATQAKESIFSNTALQWARENLETSPHLGEDACVSTTDCYTSYREWCIDNGYQQAMNKVRFGQTLGSHFLRRPTDVKKIGGKAVRVHTHTRFKREGETNADEEKKAVQNQYA